MANVQIILRTGGKALLIMAVLSYAMLVVVDKMHGSDLYVDNNEARDDMPTFRSIASYSFNCTNVKEIKILKKLGTGTSRKAFLGLYRGKEVVVKTVNKDIAIECLKDFEEYQDKPLKEMIEVVNNCSSKDMRHMLMEIIYHAVLNFRPFSKNLGFCLNDTAVYGPEYKSVSALSRELVSIHEYGNQTTEEELGKIPFSKKLRYIQEFSELIQKMNNTIIGPVAMVDLQVRHLLMINDELRIYDLGLYVSEDIPCGHFNTTNNILRGLASRSNLYDDQCLYGAQCVNGICQNMHHQLNVFLIGRKIFRYWLNNNI